MVFSIKLENSDQEEADEFLGELSAPLDKNLRWAEKNIGKWLRS